MTLGRQQFPCYFYRAVSCKRSSPNEIDGRAGKFVGITTVGLFR